jgi:hypothetical protein
MHRCRSTHPLIVVLLASLPLAAWAQTPSPYSAAITWSAGEGKGGSYYERDMFGIRVGVSARHWLSAKVGVVAEVAGETLSMNGSIVDICYPNPAGGCGERYPHSSGGTGTVGLILAPSSNLEMRVSAGGGVYTKGSRAAALVGDADVVAFAGSHVGIVVGMRGILLPDYRGDRLSEVPFTFRLRVR